MQLLTISNYKQKIENKIGKIKCKENKHGLLPYRGKVVE